MRLCFKSGLVASATLLLLTTVTADAAQVTVAKVERNPDGTTTYHFAIKVEEAETMGPATSDQNPADFVTIYNFYGLIEGSVKTPDGWQFSSEPSGRTPAMGGYPLVLPIDVPGTPNITWTPTAPAKPGTEVTGFAATTRVGTMTDGMYSVLVTQRAAPIEGAAGPAAAGAMVSKQAQIGMIESPSFLADVKK
jgi:hypothetical protein